MIRRAVIDMPDRWNIRFGRVGQAVAPYSSRFGGQPDWLTQPMWPIGRTLGEPMRFLAQIELPEPLRLGGHRVAYLFLADHQPQRGNAPFDEESGDNAVILQGGDHFHANVETRLLERGPTLRLGREPRFGLRVEEAPESPEVQVPVYLDHATEPAPLSQVEQRELWIEDRAAYDAYSSAMSGSKVGGSPHWIQGDDTPRGGPWKLLAQVDAEHIPCWAPFMDVLYAFMSADGRQGRMLYQMT